MTNYLAFITYLYKPYLDACMDTLRLPAKNLLIIDGQQPGDGGCAWAINRGFEEMIEQGAEWFILINPAMRFGKAGGRDMLEKLGKTKADFVYFADQSGKSFAWHCCAIRRKVIDAVGKMDTNFSPVYFEDVDYDLRYHKLFGDRGIVKCRIDAYNESIGHSVELAGSKPDINYLITYFATKWGIHPSAVKELRSYDKPFNDKNNSLAFFPPANGDTWHE